MTRDPRPEPAGRPDPEPGRERRRASDPEPDPEPGHETRREHSRLYRRLHANPAIALASKVTVALVGGLVVLAGMVMIVTPGPALVLIPLGLAILATEFRWARRWLEKAREQARLAKERAEAMDPRVRRRRMLLTGLAVLVVVAVVGTYLWLYDWPGYAVSGWNWVQGLSGWVPELPGM
jgi:uncharacterized protein (TIGR02611 family)